MRLKNVALWVVCLVFFVVSGFETAEDDGLAIIHQTLSKHYDAEADAATVRRYELNLTATGFCRYRKTYKNGKTELFSFNVLRFKDLDYYGNAKHGKLYLSTQSDDVIVQTRNDRRDVDSMATYMVIPLKDIDTEVLNTLAAQFKQVHERLLAVRK